MTVHDVAFLITESSYFLSHRRNLAAACIQNGWRPMLIANVADEDVQKLTGIPVTQLDMKRASHHPLREIQTLLRTFLTLRDKRPALIHAVALKPVLYGALAARVLNIKIVCALAGLGYLFTSGSLHVRLLRRLIIALMRLTLKSPKVHVILQNDDDAEKLLAHRVLDRQQLTIIRGSGVDLHHYCPQTDQDAPEPNGPVVFAVVSRMLADKGIREVVLAARLLKWRGIACRVQLIGDPDPHNPSALPRQTLQAWHAEGVIEWLGFQDDIAQVWRNAHVCVLPSYREGLPKTLLEAAACGRPIITTDVPGCRAVVTDGEQGILVAPRNWRSLADAMERLALSPSLRTQMGQAARKRAEAEFGQDQIADQTMTLYRRIMGAS